ncbi:hypothetical protein HYFRA_00003341 [Hymenoscyphus fraxineus]|uniref:Uncharacterized protein n=1 Tax=Hymenoscyphus fraxineus TaxID=746836 RepID=A0A9N9KX88_9HELO|nr:hypothetical protein HYFRA_00003341 [Hymenoscyphus fraxineus]
MATGALTGMEPDNFEFQHTLDESLSSNTTILDQHLSTQALIVMFFQNHSQAFIPPSHSLQEISHTSSSESSLLLNEFASTISQERRRSTGSTKLKKNRRSGYWNIRDFEVSHHFHGFDGDYCNTKKDKIIIMSRQYIQEPEKREVSKTGFHEPFCGDRNTTRPHPQAIIGANAIITAENIPKLRHRNPSSFFSKRKGKATSHGKILMSEYNTSNVSSIAEETSAHEHKLANKHKRDSGIHIDSMDSSRQSSSDKSDQSIRSRSSSSSSEDSAKSRSRRRKILSKFKF